MIAAASTLLIESSEVRLDRGQIECPDADMVEVLRLMSPAQRLSAAHAMWRHARVRVETSVREQHPDWSEARVASEIRRRMIGSG